MLEEEEEDPVRAATVRPPLGEVPGVRGSGSRLRRSARFARELEEIEKFWVLTLNNSRFLSVTPASMEIRMQIKLPNVRPNGRATQTNLPTPILLYWLCIND